MSACELHRCSSISAALVGAVARDPAGFETPGGQLLARSDLPRALNLFARRRPLAPLAVGWAQTSASTGTAEVVVVGWEASPCRSNTWPLAMPPM